MKTIKYSRDKLMPILSGNSFAVYSSDLLLILPNRTALVSTGIKINKPENMEYKIEENLRKDIVVINVFEDEGMLKLVIVPNNGYNPIYIRPLDKLCKISIRSTLRIDEVRFVEVDESSGKRLANYGEANNTLRIVENTNNNGDIKIDG
jgi:dUTPase